MSRASHALIVVALAALTVLAVAWWTPWLDPYVAPLSGWRQQLRQTEAGRHLSPAPKPHWITIAPGERAACLRQAGGELNAQYVICRSGRRELVRDNLDGTRSVLQVQALDDSGVSR